MSSATLFKLRHYHQANGGRGRTRTCTPQLRRLMLYPLSYAPFKCSVLTLTTVARA